MTATAGANTEGQITGFFQQGEELNFGVVSVLVSVSCEGVLVSVTVFGASKIDDTDRGLLHVEDAFRSVHD